MTNWNAAQKEVLTARKIPPEGIVHVNAPFELPEIETDSPLARAIFKLLLGDDPDALQTVRKLGLAETIASPAKLGLLQEVRNTFQRLLKALFHKFEGLKKEDIFWAEGLVGHLLSYYTLFAPDENEKLSVPVYEAGRWLYPLYGIEKINLTPSWLGSPACAFGMRPLNGTHPLLLFKGTAYPTDQGFILQVFSDINPFASIGSYLFYFGKGAIDAWLQKAGGKVSLYGLSLGGALAEHAAVCFPFNIERVFAYNAPALFYHEVKSWNEQYRRDPEALPKVMIFLNERDIVPHAGFSRGLGWEVFRVLSKSPEDFPETHMRCYLSRKEHIVLKVAPKEKGFWSEVVAFVHQLLSIPLFLIGILIYFPVYWFRSKRVKS